MLNDGVFLLILLVVLIVSGYLLHRLVACTANRLEWQDLIATRGSLNSYKLGYWVGVFLGAWVIVKQTYMGSLDAGIFGVYMGFIAGANVAMAAVGSKGSRKVDNPDG